MHWKVPYRYLVPYTTIPNRYCLPPLNSTETGTDRYRNVYWNGSLKLGRRKAHASLWSQNGCPVASPIKNVQRCKHRVCFSLSDVLLPPLYHHCALILWPTNSVHWAITVATTVPSFGDHSNPSIVSHHGNGSASTLPPLSDMWCHYSSFDGSKKVEGSCCSSYTETGLSGLSGLIIFLVAQRWDDGHRPM